MTSLDRFSALRDREEIAEQLGTIERRAEESLSQAVYRRLRKEILQGTLRPNERLVETELSELLEVSRTPVRDALSRLEAHGLVDGGRRGWAVHEYDRDELVAIYETRAALEGAAAQLAAVRATDEELASIAELLEIEREELRSASNITSQQNSEFHSSIFRACRNERLLSLIERNAEFYFNYRVANLYTLEELESTIEGHYGLLAALKARDGSAAYRVQSEHLFQALETLLRKGHW